MSMQVKRIIVAILAGLIVLVACWAAQSTVAATIHRINHRQAAHRSAHYTQLTPHTQLTPRAYWDRWALAAHPQRVIRVSIQVTESPRADDMQIDTSYTLIIRHDDPLAGPVRRGLALGHPYAFFSGVQGSVNPFGAKVSLAEFFAFARNCTFCYEPGHISAPSVQQAKGSPDLVVSSSFDGTAGLAGLTQVALIISHPLTPNGHPYHPAETAWRIKLTSREWSIVGIRGVVPSYQTPTRLTASFPSRDGALVVYLEKDSQARAPVRMVNVSGSAGSGPAPSDRRPALPSPGYFDQPNAPVLAVLLVIIVGAVVGVRALAGSSISRLPAVILGVVAAGTIGLDAAEGFALAVLAPPWFFAALHFASVAWWMLVPFIILLGLISFRRDPAHPLAPVWAVLPPLTVAYGIVIVFSVRNLSGPHLALILSALVAAAAVPALALWLLGWRHWMWVGSLAGALLIAAAVGTRLRDLKWLPGSWWIVGGMVVLGLLWAPALAVAAAKIAGRRGLGWWVGSAVVAAVLYLPVVSLLTRQDILGFRNWFFFADLYKNSPQLLSFVSTDALATFIIIALIFLLRALGDNADVESNRLALTSGLFLVAATVSPIVSWFEVSLTDVLASVAALVTFSFLGGPEQSWSGPSGSRRSAQGYTPG